MKWVRYLSCPVLVFLCAILAAKPGVCHTRSKGKSTFHLSEDGFLKIQIGMTTLDFLDLSDIDLGSPNQPQENQVQAERFLTYYFPKYLKIQLEPIVVTCPVVYEKMQLPDYRNIELFVVAQCPTEQFNSAKQMRIDWGLFTGTILMHQSYTSFLWGENFQQNWVFSRREPSKTVNLEKPNAWAAGLSFFKEGFWHLATGYDHLCFLLLLFLACTQIKILVLWVSGFTIAHGISLVLSYFNLVRFPGWIVEAGIALSILLTAIHLLWSQPKHTHTSPHSWSQFSIIILFGILHGLGFSYLLQELLTQSPFLWLSIFSFHAGLEIAQILFLSLFGLVALQLRKRQHWTKIQNIVVGAIGLLSGYWFLERLF